MPRFAANLNTLWAELPYLDRFDAAAEAGFVAVEVLQPYDVPAPETQAALRRNGLQMVRLSAPGPNYTGGARGFAAVPGGEARFDYDMRRAVRYAQALGASVIHVMCGTSTGDAARDTLISNLRRASQALPPELTLTIEALGPTHHPDHVLHSLAQAADVIDAVAAKNVGIAFNSAHAHDMTGEVASAFTSVAPLVRHVTIADAPGLNAPGLGDIDFAALFTAIDASEYTGWVAAQYKADGNTDKTLDWMR